MAWDRIAQEEQAVQSLMNLYEQVKKCQQLHEQANMPMPEALKRFLGASLNGVRPQIAPPERPDPPTDAGGDWIWIDVAQASPQSLALAVLRGSPNPVRSRDIIESITEMLPDANRGSIANIGTRLKTAGIIERSSEGWRLSKPDEAGLIRGKLLWGPSKIFSKPELAAHRRDAILHVLKHFNGGLQTVQIVEQLRNSPWVCAPINKDLVKDDMEILSKADKVKRAGNSKKWKLATVKT